MVLFTLTAVLLTVAGIVSIVSGVRLRLKPFLLSWLLGSGESLGDQAEQWLRTQG